MAMHDRTRRSRFYQEALQRAKEYLDNPDKLDNLVHKASEKSNRRSGSMKDIAEQFALLLELLRRYRSGEYRDVSTKAVMLTIASMLYFVIPVDLIPDILFGFGYMDDIALFGWTLATIRDELDKFDLWLREQQNKKGGTRKSNLLIEGELENPG